MVEGIITLTFMLALGVILFVTVWKSEYNELDRAVALLRDDVRALHREAIGRDANVLTSQQMNDVQESELFQKWLYAKIEGDVKRALETLQPKQKEEPAVSSCSAKERITEMRLRALETGQPIDTMELVREALTVLQSPITGYSSDGYGCALEFAQKQAEAADLLQFALDRAGNPQPATEQAEAV